jgi:glycosyltransferase involved in cell wall biosynthesis
MSNLPPYSVIIPTYNAVTYLAETVANVRSQPHPPAEIIIVDDGSTDSTAALAQSLGPDIRYFHQVNQGPAAARNLGISHARHDILAFIDADDLWPDNKIARQLGYLVDHPELEMVLGLQQTFQHVSDPADPSAPWLPRFDPPSFIYLVGCGVYRRSVFNRVGLFDVTLRYGEDTDWFFRSWEQDTPMHMLFEPMLHYRIHVGGMTHGRDVVQKGYLRVLKKSIDRRRLQSGALGTVGVRAFPWLFKQTTPEQLASILAQTATPPKP